MTQETAVKMMMLLDIIPNEQIPEDCRGDIAMALHRMYQVGFEANSLSRTHQLPVKKHALDGRYLMTYPSLTNAARIHGVDKTAIYQALRGKIRTAAGFVWRYAEEVETVL